MKDNFDVLSAESDNKTRTILEVKVNLPILPSSPQSGASPPYLPSQTKLSEIQVELEDTTARVRELGETMQEYNGCPPCSSSIISSHMIVYLFSAKDDDDTVPFSEEGMVSDILDILKVKSFPKILCV